MGKSSDKIHVLKLVVLEVLPRWQLKAEKAENWVMVNKHIAMTCNGTESLSKTLLQQCSSRHLGESTFKIYQIAELYNSYLIRYL
jgi:hypothetical protein